MFLDGEIPTFPSYLKFQYDSTQALAVQQRNVHLCQSPAPLPDQIGSFIKLNTLKEDFELLQVFLKQCQSHLVSKLLANSSWCQQEEASLRLPLSKAVCCGSSRGSSSSFSAAAAAADLPFTVAEGASSDVALCCCCCLKRPPFVAHSAHRKQTTVIAKEKCFKFKSSNVQKTLKINRLILKLDLSVNTLPHCTDTRVQSIKSESILIAKSQKLVPI